MKITIDPINKTCPESDIFETVLSLNNKAILELGCGDAMLTRLIATTGEGRTLIATEVDTVQHEKNRLIGDLPNVIFEMAGSENIPAENNSFDVVFMFKSLHHVPIHLMTNALEEIKRVLKPDGFVYISEPIFKGDFNEVLRLFHDEEIVRKAAFEAIERSVNNKSFTLVDELFFYTPISFNSFAQFAEKVIGATHSEHQLSDELYDKVRNKFEIFVEQNKGEFLIPIRVDILSTNECE